MSVTESFDITDQNAKALLLAILKSAFDAFVVVDGRGQIVLLNRAAERMFGYQRDELSGQPIEILVPERFRERHRALRSNYLAAPKGHDVGGENCVCARRKDGSQFLTEIRLSPVEIEGVHVVLASVRDVSAREQLRQSMSENEPQLLAAQRIQQHLLPQSPPKMPGLDIAGVVMPANFAAGDQFDFLELGDDLGVLVGDVSGHGFSSALVMASTHELLRAGARLYDDIGTVLTHANRALCKEVEESFVTVLFARLNLKTHELTYANAGHPPGLVLDDRGQVKTHLESAAMPLAISVEEQYPVSGPIQLSHGDTILLMTDGVLEATSPQDEPFGIDRAIAAVQPNLRGASSEIIHSLCNAVRIFTQDDRLQDDVTVVAVKWGVGDDKREVE